MGYRPTTIEARRRVLTAAARFQEPFTIDQVWRAVGHDHYPSYVHVQMLLRDLFKAGELTVVRDGDRAAKPVIYRWADDEDHTTTDTGDAA